MVTFVCPQCLHQNSQSYEDITEKRGYWPVEGNVVCLLTAWLKYDDFHRPVKGRTYCDECHHPHSFVVAI